MKTFQLAVTHDGQISMFLPVNLVDFIRASFPHLQDPGAWVSFQLKVTLETREIYSISNKIQRKISCLPSRKEIKV